jgi:hypothetical protein
MKAARVLVAFFAGMLCAAAWPEELTQRLKADSEMIGRLFREFDVKLD